MESLRFVSAALSANGYTADRFGPEKPSATMELYSGPGCLSGPVFSAMLKIKPRKTHSIRELQLHPQDRHSLRAFPI